MSSELNSPIPVHFNPLILKMLMFTLAVSYLTTSNLPWLILGSYTILLFTASDFTFSTRHIHNCVLFLLWLSLFIPLELFLCSSLVATGNLLTWGVLLSVSYLFPFHTVHGVIKARMLKWFAIPFSSRLCFVRTLHHEPSFLAGPTGFVHSFIELDKAVIHVSSSVSFLWMQFSFWLASDRWG